jgi:metal-dependent HD superfamily phosphatase/phosphodiesterase
MVLVSKHLIHSHLNSSPILSETYSLLENDVEVQTYLRMSNTMAVKRLGYNDHGPVHSNIISGSALELFKLLTHSVEPSSVINGICGHEDARVIVLLGAYLHDIGNAVHRIDHERTGALLASGLLDRILHDVYHDDLGLAYRVKCEVLHAIFASDDSVPCLSVEAGTVTVADGTDMAGGRSRVPYLSGKNDIHSISAQAIQSVSIEKGKEKPVSIHVSMENPAGIFQIEEVIGRKIRSSGIPDLVEVVATMNGKEIKTI